MSLEPRSLRSSLPKSVFDAVELLSHDHCVFDCIESATNLPHCVTIDTHDSKLVTRFASDDVSLHAAFVEQAFQPANDYLRTQENTGAILP